MALRVLFIGGTGVISSACTALAAERGLEVTLFNRGQRAVPVPPGVRVLHGDIQNAADRERLAREHFDAVVNWIVYTPAELERDVRLFSGHAGQYVFISSASAYEKPPRRFPITEDTPLCNPFWPYAQEKIACERKLRELCAQTDLPFTIVRPSHTYGPQLVPAAYGNSAKPWTLLARMRAGKPVIVHGDGTTLWTLTFNTDFARGFVPLLGLPAAWNEHVHITSDEALSWNEIYAQTGAALGVEPQLLHVPSQVLHRLTPGGRGTLIGDKMFNAVFDNAKLRRWVPEFRCDVPFAQGIRESVRWLSADPARQQVDHELDRLMDRIVEKMAQI